MVHVTRGFNWLGLVLLGLAVSGCGESASKDENALATWPGARELPETTLAFPGWARQMRLWPFDVVTTDMSDQDIAERIDAAGDAEATAVIFYMESEHMYGSFVDEDGFAAMLDRVETLVDRAKDAELKTLVYVNGLEVMTRGAYDDHGEPTGVPTMANQHPDWLQLDLDGEPIVYGGVGDAWLEPDWEDAWMSPLSGYRDFFLSRVGSLAEAGVDGIYVDATFLPGFQLDEENLRWGSTDRNFAEAFTQETELDLPTEVDFDSEEFRAFLGFRHEVLADYLGEIQQEAEAMGLVTFWESSTNDTPEATLLGNDTAVTGRMGLGFSPEIEPEGDYLAAFRMAKAARELNQDRPMIYLGWPEDEEAAAIEFAIAISQSNNYYPTATLDEPFEGTFEFLDDIEELLADRAPYPAHLGLLYSTRNNDLTYPTEETHQAYVEAFEELTERHVPLRLLPLEDLNQEALDGVSTLVLPGLVSLSDNEVDAMRGLSVVPYGDELGTLDEDGEERDEPVDFDDTISPREISASLPFSVLAPEETFVEFYASRSEQGRLYLFCVSPEPDGKLELTAASGESLSVRSFAFDEEPFEDEGREIAVPLESFLVVVQVEQD